MNEDRRDFFKKMAGAAVTLAAAQAVVDTTLTAGKADAAADKRGFAAGHFLLTLDESPAGFLSSLEGGEATSDVVTEKLSPGASFSKKHIAGVKYEDIAVTCGTGMSAGFYGVLQDFTMGQSELHGGAVQFADFKFNEIVRLEFQQALITELGMPALDAASKDAAKMTVKFSPEVTQFKKGSGQALALCAGKGAQQKWLPSNFRLTIDGLDCTKVNKIEALTVKQKVVESPIGEGRDFGREPGAIEVPNLVVTLPEAAAQTFFDWHENFVIEGNNFDEAERSGKLEYLSPNLQDTLFTIDFHHLGIFKLTPDKYDAASNQIRHVTVEMYCEELDFSAGKASIGC